MTEYFAVINDEGLRRGPFHTIGEASRFLKDVSSDRRYTDEEARQFFLYESAVVMVETVNGREEVINVGWLAREKSGRHLDESNEPVEALKNKDTRREAQAASLISLLTFLALAIGIAEIFGEIGQ